jgi:hypothetical protein
VFEQVLVDGSLMGDSALKQLVGLHEQYFVVNRATDLQVIDVFKLIKTTNWPLAMCPECA